MKERKRAIEKQELITREVRKIRRSHSRMGGKKLYEKLGDRIRELAPEMGRDKFFDLLREKDLLVKRRRKYVVTTQSFKRFFAFKDHYNGKQWTRPNQAWVSDITYVRVGNAFQYLFLITDAFSRKIVGWELANSLETKWAIKALKKALTECRNPEGLIHHSDRGFQYCNPQYTNILNDNGAQPSMGQAGYCYDNAKAERVNGILKDEYLLDSHFRTTQQAHRATREAIYLYNNERPHWSINLKIPGMVHRLSYT